MLMLIWCLAKIADLALTCIRPLSKLCVSRRQTKSPSPDVFIASPTAAIRRGFSSPTNCRPRRSRRASPRQVQARGNQRI
ncbi:hypothetical protein B0H66DRAFT_296805 [Apodospora peruviana]|uniref:Secreted protein n=1 Tax=Apodospora peruviana TaxID=516989 RepID=A0AAE0I1E2_9PEZI|nr:hypothetical protein B0H66DRAFT_296805 [Apodospora peruviana]